MASNLSLDAVFREFAAGIEGHIPYDRISINRVDSQGGITRLFLLSPSPKDTLDTPAELYQNGESVTEWVVREKKPFIREDTSLVREFNTDERLNRMGFHSYISVPLIYSHRVVGSFHISCKQPKAYGERELAFLMSVAEWLAIAMENARLFDELKRLNREFETAAQHKSQFLARWAHELRTPLNVVIGIVDVMNSGGLGPFTEKQQAALNKIQDQGSVLIRMVNDVLNISRIEAGTIPLEVSTFRLDKLIESLRTLTEEMQRKTGLKVIWDVDPDLPLLKTDAAKLEAILQNLIVNAFKYTPEGEVHIRIKSRSESKSVEFVIEDTGGGISTENLPKIFEGFHQVRSTTSIQGVGLGLTIVKKYLELINGDIQVRSELGKGSTFTVTLPLTEQA
jgi:signal transduction histidine kinase